MHLELNWPEAECCSAEGNPYCACPPMERALRGWARGAAMPAMTPEQRAACLTEIDGVEGYRSADVAESDDRAVAGETLAAWNDYVRDKMGRW